MKDFLGLVFIIWLFTGRKDPVDAFRTALSFIFKLYAYMFGFVIIALIIGIIIDSITHIS
jgi:hypothetical protein